jgi:hypothetical protein
MLAADNGRSPLLVFIREFEFVLAKTEVFGSSLSLASPKGWSPRRLIVKNNENCRAGKNFSRKNNGKAP